MSTDNLAVVENNAGQLVTNDTFSVELPSFKNAKIAKMAVGSEYLSTAGLIPGNGFFAVIDHIGLGDVADPRSNVVDKVTGEITKEIKQLTCVFFIQVNPETGEQKKVHSASKQLIGKASEGIKSGEFLTYPDHKSNATPLWVQFDGMKQGGANEYASWSMRNVKLD